MDGRIEWNDDGATVTTTDTDGTQGVKTCDNIEHALRYAQERTNVRTVNGDLLACALALAVLAFVFAVNMGRL